MGNNENPIVIPAGQPGPDGVIRQYHVYADAFSLLYKPSSGPSAMPAPKPPALTADERIDRLERLQVE